MVIRGIAASLALAAFGLGPLVAEEGDTTPSTKTDAGATSGEDVVDVDATKVTVDPLRQPYNVYHVDRDRVDEQLPRVYIDGLHSQPGVAIQHTAANQASPFIRGLTGEQSLLLFDGIRFSHAMMRPGPNQYAALIPGEALSGTDIILGSSSAVTGSDGLTGALDFRLAEPGRGVREPISAWGRGRWGSANGGRIAGGFDGRVGDWAYSVDGSVHRFGDITGGKDTHRRIRQNDVTAFWDLEWADLGLDEDIMTGLLGLNGPPINYTGAQPHFDPLSPNPDTQEIPNTGYDQWSYGGRVAWLGLDDHRFEAAAGEVRQHDAPRPDGYKANSGRSDRISRFFPEQNFTYVHGTHRWQPDEEEGGLIHHTQVRAWWHRYEEETFRERLRSGGTVYRREFKDNAIRSYGAEAEIAIRPFEDNVLTAGGMYLMERTSNVFREERTTMGDPNPFLALPHEPDEWAQKEKWPDGSEYDTRAIFIQDEWVLFDRLTLLGSIRFTEAEWDANLWGRQGYELFTAYGALENLLSPAELTFANVFGGPSNVGGDTSNVSWSGRASFAVTDTVSVFAGYGRAFRAPSLTNLYGRTDRGSSGNIITGNPFLDPEVSSTVDVGGRWLSGPDEFQGSVFYTTVEDLIQPVGTDANFDFIPDFEELRNAEEAKIFGGEARWNVGLPIEHWIGDSRRVAVVGTFNYVRGTVDVPLPHGVQREHISRASRVFGRTGLRYEDLHGRRWVQAQVRWADRYTETEPGDASDARLSFPGVGTASGEIPGYAVLDILAGWTSVDERWTVHVGAENLLDKSYRVIGSGLDRAGLNLVAGGEIRFQ